MWNSLPNSVVDVDTVVLTCLMHIWVSFGTKILNMILLPTWPDSVIDLFRQCLHNSIIYSLLIFWCVYISKHVFTPASTVHFELSCFAYLLVSNSQIHLGAWHPVICWMCVLISRMNYFDLIVLRAVKNSFVEEIIANKIIFSVWFL